MLILMSYSHSLVCLYSSIAGATTIPLLSRAPIHETVISGTNCSRINAKHLLLTLICVSEAADEIFSLTTLSVPHISLHVIPLNEG